MYSSRDKGDLGEQAAVNYLIKNGYTIIEKNFSTRFGEIDIIARDKKCIVFIEVKSRKDFKMGLPCEAVNSAKQHKISNMALIYISMHNLCSSEFRFDVVEVVQNNGDVKYIRLIKDAFQADSYNSI